MRAISARPREPPDQCAAGDAAAFGAAPPVPDLAGTPGAPALGFRFRFEYSAGTANSPAGRSLTSIFVTFVFLVSGFALAFDLFIFRYLRRRESRRYRRGNDASGDRRRDRHPIGNFAL